MLGELLGNYRVVDKLGEGGMGVVYAGRHETLGHPVAIKVLKEELTRDANMVQRFFNEAQAASSIRNPGIAQIFDFGFGPNGSAYFVMEMLEGESLTARLKQRRLGYAECCRIGRQVANVLHAAHGRGITHRDLKPDNLFLVKDAEVIGGERVKVLDFGIAKLAGETHATGVKTRTGLVMGTPLYMSPEQCRGAGLVDARSDIYSLGCILFEMMCGGPPFTGEGAGEIVGAHLHVAPPSPQSLAPDVPPALATLIEKLLAKRPDARPQSMASVGQELDEIVHGFSATPERGMNAVPAPPLPPSTTTLGSSASTLERASPSPGARPRRSIFAIGGVAAIALVAVVAIILASRDSGEPPTAVDGKPPEVAAFADALAAAPTAVSAPPVVDAEVPPTEPAAAPPALPVPATPVSPPDAPSPESPGAPAIAASQAPAPGPATPAGPVASTSQTPSRPAPAPPAKPKNDILAARQIARINAALAQRNLKRAKIELELAELDPSMTTDYTAVRAKYEQAEAAAISELVARLQKVVRADATRDCREYNVILVQERESKPPRIAAEAARKVPCPPPAPACDDRALADAGRSHFTSGALDKALASYQAAIACKPDPSTIQKALVVACNLRSLPKARRFWKQLPSVMQMQALGTCVRNGITEQELTER